MVMSRIKLDEGEISISSIIDTEEDVQPEGISVIWWQLGAVLVMGIIIGLLIGVMLYV